MSALSYLWVAAAAFLASCADLGNCYKRSPFIRNSFAGWWVLVAVLDAAAGALVLLILVALHYPKHYPWMSSLAGLILIGLSAALIVRANLTEIQIGKTLMPIGPGIAYGSVRSWIEPRLVDRDWALSDAESDGRRTWILEKVDASQPALTFTHARSKLETYIVHRYGASNGGARMSELNKEADAALKNDDESDQVKQLVTFMSEKHYLAPLYRLLGRPSRATVKAWRTGA